jgi:hypothetical protein
MPLNDKFHVLIGSEYEYLAFTEDGKRFRMMTPADLNECRRMGEFYSCPRGNVIRRAPEPHREEEYMKNQDPELCLWALYHHKYEMAKAVCETSIVFQETAAVQLGPNDFALYSRERHGGVISCRNGTAPATRQFVAHQLTFVHLEAGCTARTKDHIISASDVGFIRDSNSWSSHVNWPSSAADLSKNLNLTRLAQLLEEDKKEWRNRTSIRLEEAEEAVNNMTPVEEPEGLFQSLIPHIPGGVAGLIAFISLGVSILLCLKVVTLEGKMEAGKAGQSIGIASGFPTAPPYHPRSGFAPLDNA